MNVLTRFAKLFRVKFPRLPVKRSWVNPKIYDSLVDITHMNTNLRDNESELRKITPNA